VSQEQQVAQLSQRDRAAGCVSFGQKWKTGTERQYERIPTENRRFSSNGGRLTQNFVRYKNLDTSFFRFVTNHAFDRRTDGRTDGRTVGQTEFSSLDRVCTPCSAVKSKRTVTWKILSRISTGNNSLF